MSKKLVLVALFVTTLGMPVMAVWVPDANVAGSESGDTFGYVGDLAMNWNDLDFTDPNNPISTFNVFDFWLSSYEQGAEGDPDPPFENTYTSPASGNEVFHWLRADFTETVALDRMLIWNGTTPSYSNRSLKDVDVYYTSDGGANWNLLISTTFTQADGGVPRTASDVVSFGGLSVDAVVIDINSCYYSEGDPFNYASVQQVLFEYFFDESTEAVYVITTDGVSVAEAGETDTYFVRLGAAPSSNVTITATRSSDDITLDAGSGPAASVDLVFTPGNYNLDQTVTVEAVDDGLSEGPEVVTITHTLASGDAGYAAITPDSVLVNVADNEPYCGQIGQVYSAFDVTGPNDVPDCFVDMYDVAAFTSVWLGCTDLTVPGCDWAPLY